MPATAVTAPLAFVNHALALLGEDPITDFLPASGAVNAMAAEIYPRVVDTLLSVWPWNFALRRLALSRLTDSVHTPPAPWLYAFDLPPYTLRVVRSDLGDGEYLLTSDSRPDSVGERRLLAMRDAISLDVIIRPTDELFPAHFTAALIPALAAEFAPAVTGKLDLAQYFDSKAARALSRAKTQDYNENPARSLETQALDPRNVAIGDAGNWVA